MSDKDVQGMYNLTQHITYQIESESGPTTVYVRAYTAATVRWLLAAHPAASVRDWTAADERMYGLPQINPHSTSPLPRSGGSPAPVVEREAKRGAILGR